MSSHVIFAHFGFSLFAELLRHQSRPCLLRVERCGKCISRCCARISSCCSCIFRCLCRCRIRRAGEQQVASQISRRSSEDLADGATGDAHNCGLKWYWFHFAMQVGFAVREFVAVSHLNGWHWELVLVHIATWFTILLVGREVWHFSKVRHGGEERKIAVDRLLDMLLLPLNIVFFCGVCVRVLKLQRGSHLQGMVSVILECSDIYEALALKSVYVLFVKVVEKEMRSTDVARTEGEFRYFKEFFLYGVLSWVTIQIGAVFMKLVLQGLIAVYAPTLCYWASHSCTTCDQWFENNFGLALSATTFLLCSFAIAFVLYFELAYSDYLKKIGPGWKFLGVKGIVSVTYTQYILIQLAASPLGWDDTQVYLVHCLLYAAWMPLLAAVHTLFAYPFYASMRRDTEQRAEWLEAWLGTLDDSTVVEHPPENAICSRRICLYLTLACFSCVASTWLLIDLVPPSSDALDIPIYNKTCTGQGDIAHFLETSNFHLAMRNDTLQTWSVPGIAGAWLPYCSTAQVACAGGYFPTRAPSVQCLPTGLYQPHGSCLAISCGPPLRLPHAQPRTQDIEKQNFSLGVTVHYDCDAGYRGNLQAVCNPNRSWTWSGNCTEITCDAPPNIPHAKPVLEPGKNIGTGTVVRYQCDDMFNGTPTAACGDDGQYVTAGRCKRECGPPPVVPHAVPNFTNPHVYEGWFEGSRCPYVCELGFEGYVTALCGADGNYTVAGKCKTVFCGDAPRLPHATPHMDEIKRQNFTFGVTIHYDCDQPRFQGKLEAMCNITGRWVVHGNCSEVHCGRPPAIKNATPVQHSDGSRQPIAAGTVIRYQCNSTYNGTPSATCGDDGMYVTEGRCTKECGPPPSVPNSSPAIDNALLAAGWLAGMGVSYRCDPGFEGAATAVCTDAGTYIVQGLCKTAAAIETAQLYSRITGLTTAIGIENILLFGAVGLFCWRTGRLSGLMSARRGTSTSAAGSGPSHELAEGLSGLDRCRNPEHAA